MSKRMLPVARKDILPTTQKSFVIYEYKCHCDSRYVEPTSQRLQDRIKQHVPQWLRQWFSTGVPRNPRVPPVQSRGSARSDTNLILLIKLNAVFCIRQLNYCTRVPRATGMFSWSCASAKRLKTTGLRQQLARPRRFQPHRSCKQNDTKPDCDSAIGQHLLDNDQCTLNYDNKRFSILAAARSSFHLNLLEAAYFKTRRPVLSRQKEFVYTLKLFR